jgi:hypothetical protein
MKRGTCRIARTAERQRPNPSHNGRRNRQHRP